MYSRPMGLTGLGCSQSADGQRRSTTEVHPKFSEAPHLRSSIPHPKTDFSKNQIASRRIIPWPKPTKRFLSKSRLTFRRFGVKEPRLTETKRLKCATSTTVEQVVIRADAVVCMRYPTLVRVLKNVLVRANSKKWVANDRRSRLPSLSLRTSRPYYAPSTLLLSSSPQPSIFCPVRALASTSVQTYRRNLFHQVLHLLPENTFHTICVGGSPNSQQAW